jgi:hypothetical protein
MGFFFLSSHHAGAGLEVTRHRIGVIQGLLSVLCDCHGPGLGRCNVTQLILTSAAAGWASSTLDTAAADGHLQYQRLRAAALAATTQQPQGLLERPTLRPSYTAV